ncbi:MAG TPA: NAD-dependent epimerase/dehydratase family protein [Streptosporangiaceae bacterium]|nr:NAD-dependent epimerase/dehydratase family protein [Streptosporangiaceae bacterium]
MRLLIIGGTAFVGRHITEAALASGHEVTLFNRGRRNPGLFPQATHLVGDRNSDLTALATGEWDATVDVCAYFPRQVRSLAAALDGRGGHHIFISSTSAYQVPVAAGFTEDAPLAKVDDPETEELTDETYGGLKVLCERTAADLYGEANTAVVRPTYVIGPHDLSYRFTWWVERLAQGGTVLAPGDPADPIQVIDARDMANWIVGLAAGRVSGTYHAVSPPPPYGFGDMLEAIASEVAPPGTELVWVDSQFLLTQGVDEASLPLWPAFDGYGDINAANPGAAIGTGLRPRPVARSAAEVHAAQATDPVTPREGVGLSPDREAALLKHWSTSRG